MSIFIAFLNKNVTIVAVECVTTNTFVSAGIVARYAWNSVPVDDTNILRNIPEMDRELTLTLDINLNAIPKLV